MSAYTQHASACTHTHTHTHPTHTQAHTSACPYGHMPTSSFDTACIRTHTNAGVCMRPRTCKRRECLDMAGHPSLQSCWLEGNPLRGAAAARVLEDAPTVGN